MSEIEQLRAQVATLTEAIEQCVGPNCGHCAIARAALAQHPTSLLDLKAQYEQAEAAGILAPDEPTPYGHALAQQSEYPDQEFRSALGRVKDPTEPATCPCGHPLGHTYGVDASGHAEATTLCTLCAKPVDDHESVAHIAQVAEATSTPLGDQND